MEILSEVQQIATHYSRIRKHSLDLCADLEIEDFVAQPTSFVSPPKWHLAHTTWFFETFVLSEFMDDYEPFHPKFAYIFNSYYQHAGERASREERGSLTRPSVEEIKNYRTYVDHAMEDLLQSSKGLIEEVTERVYLGLQHEQQHQELLVYDMKYILGHNPLFPKLKIDLPELKIIDLPNYIDLEEGVHEVGFKGDEFHFDNEVPSHKVYINKAKMATELVSNEQFLAFIEAGGYSDFRFWLDEGWSWVRQNQIQAPAYWHQIDSKWYQYRLNKGLQAVQEQEPVMHVSFYEADAIARFYEAELPSEFERELCWDKLDNGDLWEWTASAYRPYPGFKAQKGALGEYNGKFMVNQMVLKGGSIATPKNHIRPSYRNFFHANERWMYSGIRLLKR